MITVIRSKSFYVRFHIIIGSRLDKRIKFDVLSHDKVRRIGYFTLCVTITNLYYNHIAKWKHYRTFKVTKILTWDGETTMRNLVPPFDYSHIILPLFAHYLPNPVPPFSIVVSPSSTCHHPTAALCIHSAIHKGSGLVPS